jgi:hypothetical protein
MVDMYENRHLLAVTALIVLTSCADLTTGVTDAVVSNRDASVDSMDATHAADALAEDLQATDGQKPCPLDPKLEGDYVGTFDGTISTPYNVKGSVTFSLQRIGSEEFFTIKTGKMTGLSNGQFPFTADLQGTVKCNALQATIANGLVDILTFKVPFTGKMSGQWTGVGFPNGIWSGQSVIGVTGSGTWQVKHK